MYCINSEPEGGLYLSMTLPSLVVGTVGGGTALATQQECLQLMGCTGKARHVLQYLLYLFIYLLLLFVFYLRMGIFD